MRSLIGGAAQLVRAQTPVPFAPRRTGLLTASTARHGDPEAQMAAMGTVGTLFAIVTRSATSTSMVHWDMVRRRDGRGRIHDEPRPVTSHAALDLLHHPNPYMTGQHLFEATQQHIDLVGEGYWVLVRTGPLPLEIWPVRPDRIEPVPHARDFLAGYIYTGPDGDKVPLDVQDVICFKLPNPLDPYRGMGPVQAVLADLDSARYSAEWNRNFFLNSAEPGGIVEVEKRLTDPEWEEMVQRWRAQHQGVAQAHRVAILERAKWVDRKFTQRDMQFAQLREVSRDIIREAFGMSKTMLGQTEDVNRATAEAAEYVFARWHLVSRLERFKAALDNDLLPRYGGPTRALEFLYEDPVPEDAEREREDRTSRVNGTVRLVAAGFDPAESLDAMGLPEITWVGVPGVQDVGDDDGGAQARRVLRPENRAPRMRRWATRRLRAALRALRAQEPDPDDDGDKEVEDLDRDFQDALASVLAAYAPVQALHVDQIVEQVEDAVRRDDQDALQDLRVSTRDGDELVGDSLVALAAVAAVRVAQSAKRQGVPDDAISVGSVDEDDLRDRGRGAVGFVARRLVVSAASEAQRVWGPTATPTQVANDVRDFLDGLTDRDMRDKFGGALQAAQNRGRLATLEQLPEATYSATEQLDTNTCDPCRGIDEHVFASLADAMAVYGGGGYKDCLGRDRCRGTVVARWPKAAADDQ